MPLGLESTDFLSHIDEPLEPSQRDAIIAQIRAEQPKDALAQLHPNIPSDYEPSFSELIIQELDRVATKGKLEGIDVSRYEASALEAPSNTSPHSDERNPQLLEQWRTTLQRAYGLKTYLDGRYTNLSLLETYGKNAWLISNAGLEEELKALQKEVEEMKNQSEIVEEQRRARQANVKAEMEGLEDSWKKGVRGIVEVELASEQVRAEILTKRRAGAVG